MTIRGKKNFWPIIASLGLNKDFETLVTVDGVIITLERLVLVHATPTGAEPRCLEVVDDEVRLRKLIISIDVGDGGLTIASKSASSIEECLVLASTHVEGNDRHQSPSFHNNLLLGRQTYAERPTAFQNCTIAQILQFKHPPSTLIDCFASKLTCHDGGTASVHRIARCNLTLGVNFEGARSGIGADCISVPFQFRDPANLDYRLVPGSPGKGMASDGGDIGVRYTPEMMVLWRIALELRAKRVIKF